MAKRKGQHGKRGGSTAKSAQRRKRQPDRPVLGLALLGMLITLYLTVTASTSAGLPLCAEGSACDIIQGSRWSTLFGIPVALFGFLTYGLIAFVSFEMKPTLRRWRWQWAVSLIGLTVSLYLTALGLYHLQAVCLWCLASLAVITAIFIWLTVRRPEAAPGRPWKDWLINTGAAALVVVGVMQLHYSNLLSPGFGRADPQLQALATHLAEQDARFFGASWCPACQQQKDLFGAASEELPYVECSPRGRGGLMASVCVTAGIESYPTWVINGQRHEGVLEPERLARLSGFRWATTQD
ncbi:vitamin K epoxide reductase family protein [Natronospira bacteriovora]|uniref:Vitamin K epoxide reductase family protein n=1 Tax=Natronospira bacteriovora TaxID=3069753 RepID=A0ABU0W9K5_9GAMM|nr:vitamin K epoxide reductase family protein [Natronospira sp. AB-CW4]MDQ2070700.1 vitamin K epoxide reductase family protein [Natronospira sp. AB-CW4]